MRAQDVLPKFTNEGARHQPKFENAGRNYRSGGSQRNEDTVMQKRGKRKGGEGVGNHHARYESCSPIARNAWGSHGARKDFSFQFPFIATHLWARGPPGGKARPEAWPARNYPRLSPTLWSNAQRTPHSGSRQNPTYPEAKLRPGRTKVTSIVGRRYGDVDGDCTTGTAPHLGPLGNIGLARSMFP